MLCQPEWEVLKALISHQLIQVTVYIAEKPVQAQKQARAGLTRRK
jgi:hypothetical protein